MRAPHAHLLVLEGRDVVVPELDHDEGRVVEVAEGGVEAEAAHPHRAHALAHDVRHHLPGPRHKHAAATPVERGVSARPMYQPRSGFS